MDIHTRIVAVLHIVFGAVGAIMLLILGLGLGGFAAFTPHGHVPGFVFGLGALFLGFFVLLSLVDVIAGVALLKGSRNARVFVIVIGALGLFSFPWGTLLGIYTLWALLRKQPVPDVV
jgi:hypothetical protein